MKVCAVEGCGRPHYARGWCNMHWSRARRNGDPTVVRSGRPCSVCAHPDAEAINRQILAWTPYVDIAARVGISRQMLARHAREHLHLTKPMGNGTPCSVCSHPDVATVDQLLDAGVSPNRVAAECGFVDAGVVYMHASRVHQERRLAAAAARLDAVRRYVS